MDSKFDRIGSKAYNIIGPDGLGKPQVVGTITADWVKFEPGFVTFWVGDVGEEKRLVATAKADETLLGVTEVKLEGELLEKYLAWQNSRLTDFNRSHFDHFVNVETGQSYREYKALKDRPIPPDHAQHPCKRRTSHDAHEWSDGLREKVYCPGRVA